MLGIYNFFEQILSFRIFICFRSTNSHFLIHTIRLIKLLYREISKPFLLSKFCSKRKKPKINFIKLKKRLIGYSNIFEEFLSNLFNSSSSSLVNSRNFPVGTSNFTFIILIRFSDFTLYPKDSHILLI